MSENLELNFDDLSLIEVPVTIAGKKYVLREASEATAAAYRNASIAGAKMEDGRVSELPRNLGGLQSLLVSQCLFPYVVVDSEVGSTISSIPVARSLINGWPSRIVKPLFEKAKEISELDEDESLEALIKQRNRLNERIVNLEGEPAKNAPRSMVDG